MTDAPDLAKLSDEIYDHQEIGIAYFERFRFQLAGIGFSAVLEHQMLTYPVAYVREFILGTPFLWQDLPPSVWVEMLRRQAWRPKPVLHCELDSGVYGDIEFLSAMVGVDALAYVLQADGIDMEGKRRVAEHFWSFPYRLVPDPVDLEDLDDGRRVSRRVVESLQQVLVQDFGFRPVTFGSQNIGDHLEPLVRPLITPGGPHPIRLVLDVRLGEDE